MSERRERSGSVSSVDSTCSCEQCELERHGTPVPKKRNVGPPECILIVIGVSLLVIFWILQHSFKIVGIPSLFMVGSSVGKMLLRGRGLRDMKGRIRIFRESLSDMRGRIFKKFVESSYLKEISHEAAVNFNSERLISLNNLTNSMPVLVPIDGTIYKLPPVRYWIFLISLFGSTTVVLFLLGLTSPPPGWTAPYVPENCENTLPDLYLRHPISALSAIAYSLPGALAITSSIYDIARLLRHHPTQHDAPMRLLPEWSLLYGLALFYLTLAAFYAHGSSQPLAFQFEASASVLVLAAPVIWGWWIVGSMVVRRCSPGVHSTSAPIGDRPNELASADVAARLPLPDSTSHHHHLHTSATLLCTCARGAATPDPSLGRHVIAGSLRCLGVCLYLLTGLLAFFFPNPVIGVAVLAALCAGSLLVWLLAFRPRHGTLLAVGSVVLGAVGLLFWIFDTTRTWCAPASAAQFTMLWHIFTALALCGVLMLWRAPRKQPARHRSAESRPEFTTI
ncbi:hypothetical protein PAPYR_6351 [Paratrimastix pyriformis]|uniref:Uncharacterized protein n=1 Tax=Paratrimastix pyriformis TaxID=342808 RepID=A0ABQ8UFM1_9EUKA|nr:hypothetical protein PAPYR_6351 [Paratrimastix pyriformis]